MATLDAGIFYQADRISTGVNYFHSRQTNSIVQIFDGSMGSYQNLGSLTFQGLEWEGKYHLNHAFFLSGSMLVNIDKVNPGVSPVSPSGGKSGDQLQGPEWLGGQRVSRFIRATSLTMRAPRIHLPRPITS